MICLAIYTPLVLVRKIEVFAVTHLFGDIMIILTIFVIFSYAGYYVHTNDGWSPQGLKPIDPVLWPDAIGFSVYAFEGIGVILPIKQVTGVPEQYFKILCTTVMFIGGLYIVFPEICVFAFGEDKL